MKKIRQRLTYANVMSSIAVFLILGGATALAAGQLGKNTVGAKQLKKNAVTAAKIKANSIKTTKLADASVTTSKLADKAVNGAKIDTTTLGAVPTAANAANAAKLGGLAANEIVRGSTATATSSINDFNAAAFTDLVSKQVTVPKAGILLIWGQANVNRDTDDADPAMMRLRGALDNGEATTETTAITAENGTTGVTGTVSGAIAVTAGTHTVSLQGREVGAGLSFITDRSVTTLFVPFGDSGVQGNLGS